METYLHDLAVRQARNHRVTVVVANDCPRTETSSVDSMNVHRIAKFGTVASMPVCPGLLGAIRRTPADLVHLHMPNPGAALALLMSGHSGKLVITHHADTVGRENLRRISDPFVKKVMERADRIIASSHRYLVSSRELAPFRDKCRVIPMGIDVPPSLPVDCSIVREVRARFGDRLLLAIGRLVPYKGFDVLVRAMKYVDARLLLVGNGPLAASLLALAAAEGVTHKISILPRVHDLSLFFAAASVFVLPSVNRAEAFGIAQVEAMAAGLPIINTDIDSGVPEVSRHRQTGLTVTPGSPRSLAQAIEVLLAQRDLRRQFGAAARTRVEAEYTADLMAKRTMDVYEEVLPVSKIHLISAA